MLIAFEGLDQSGKQTQAEGLRDRVIAGGRACRMVSFPDHDTAIGAEIRTALHGGREYAPDVLQLLFVANRYQYRSRIQGWVQAGAVVLCDRYLASSIAYGEAQGLDPAWMSDVQKFLPQPDLTVLLDIEPETAVRRKAAGRDRFERDMALLSRVRQSYLRQAAAPGWLRVDGERSKDEVAHDVIASVETRLALP